mmetsp:Transcript_29853/g.91891  ORF Transcript_29853/g.91891 Transcript_29853/m.91891 type:complete len:243 (-) Transcript_29853:144-872(-)
MSERERWLAQQPLAVLRVHAAECGIDVSRRQGKRELVRQILATEPQVVADAAQGLMAQIAAQLLELTAQETADVQADLTVAGGRRPGRGSHRSRSRGAAGRPNAEEDADERLARRLQAEEAGAVRAVDGLRRAARLVQLDEMARRIQRRILQSETDDQEASRGCLSQEALDTATTTMTFTKASGSCSATDAASEECAVCLEPFTQGETLRLLPCAHRYHRACIDQWLAMNTACPLCKHVVGR